MNSTLKKLAIRLKFAPIIVVSIYLMYLLLNLPRSTSMSSRFIRFGNSFLNPPPTKQILMWNTFFSAKHFEYFDVGQKIFEDSQCEWTNCNISDMQDGEPAMKYEDYDVIWMFGKDLPRGILLHKKPPIRKEHQRYLFFQTESPSTNHFDYRPMKHFFNLTLTYRTDSDIYMPYGWFQSKSESIFANPSRNLEWIEPDFLNIELPKSVSNKTKLVAWIVSNCHSVSERESYAVKLSKHIQVDIYGSCSNKSCGNECFIMLEQEYKFYLAFENSLCQDYVTEKLYRSYELNIVPIVLGGADYSLFVPPRSYIDINDFASAKDLADYLLFLDKNPVEYQKYFWWKKYYRVSSMHGHALCQLCAILNDETWPKVKMYDIQRWWNKPDVCHLPHEKTLRNSNYNVGGSNRGLARGLAAGGKKHIV